MLHVVYRSYGGENTKGRPSFYSKWVALLSLVRALAPLEGGGEVLFLNDGVIPDERLRVMRRSGEVLARERLGARGSLHAALRLPQERGWPPEDIVWFAEDDYLYAPQALRGLLGAAAAFPEADYFALYALIGARLPSGARTTVEHAAPAAWRASTARAVHAHAWTRALSTTSSFGARVGPLREDRLLMHAAMWSGGAWDHATCMLYQGYRPFSWRQTLDPMREHGSSIARGATVASVRVGLNAWRAVRALRGQPGRWLVAPDPPLATHLEQEFLALGTDWERVARDTTAWAAERGLS